MIVFTYNIADTQSSHNKKDTIYISNIFLLLLFLPPDGGSMHWILDNSVFNFSS